MIGDVLITSILCENIKKMLPNTTVDYLVNSNTIPVLENNPYIDNIIVFDEKMNSGILNLIKFCKEVNHNKYDVVIDGYSKLQSWINVFINNAQKKISFNKKGRTFLYTDNIIPNKEPKTFLGLAIEHKLQLLEPLGIKDPIAVEPKLYLNDLEIEQAKLTFKNFRVNNQRKTVMISLLGSEESKTYPLDKMAEVVNFIGENHNVNILFNYFPSQINQAKEVYTQLTETTKTKVYFDLLGKDLRAFIALANECEMIIGNDGGAINMTKALGKKSFIIFSPWIDKNAWSSFEDGINHVSVHLKDYKPEIFNNLKNRKIKEVVNEFYSIFDFNLIKEKLSLFLDSHLK